MNGIVFLQSSRKLIARLEMQEIGTANVKCILREYNFGSDTRMAWNASVEKISICRKWSLSLAPSRSHIHFSYLVHVAAYTHNIRSCLRFRPTNRGRLTTKTTENTDDQTTPNKTR